MKSLLKFGAMMVLAILVGKLLGAATVHMLYSAEPTSTALIPVVYHL